jgi:hypothetical protein
LSLILSEFAHSLRVQEEEDMKIKQKYKNTETQRKNKGIEREYSR